MRNILLCIAALASVCTAQDLGTIQNFIVSSYGNGYITLTWDLVAGSPDYPLHKYSLLIDDDLTSEFKCSDPSCTKTIYDLESCVEHVFDLKPIFYTPDGSDIDGEIATAFGYTEDEIPGSVSNVTVLEDFDTHMTVAWNQPDSNARCVSFYTTCFRLNGETDSYCVNSNTTQVTVVGLSACATYHIYVTPVTPSNSEGDTTEMLFDTHDGVPGEPQDVVVGLITKDTIQLLWNNPLVNLLCLHKFEITIGETTIAAESQDVKASATATGYDNEFTFTPLFPCTGYIIDVCSANEAEQTSDKVVRYASTEETNPHAPPSITVTPDGPNSIKVSWGNNENDRCAGSFEVCWMDGITPMEHCQTVEGGGDSGNILIIHDLLPCSNYIISVTVQTPNGTFFSNATTNSTSTTDVQPGPVVDLAFKAIETHQLTITYLPPETNPQCVKEIITRIIDNNQKVQMEKAVKSSKFEETFTGLEACTDYTVKVSTRSPSGLESLVEEVSNQTLGELPSAPQNLEANAITTSYITLQWYQPAVNPRCVDSYFLFFSDSSGVNATNTITSSSFKVEYTVFGLQSCTTYDFALISTSMQGNSDETTLTESTAC